MVHVSKSNPVILTMTVQPADLVRRAVQCAEATHTAALQLVYTSALYLLSVSHFRNPNQQGYLTKTDAVKYLEDQISEATGVKNRMLANYITGASYLYDTLSKSANKFGTTLSALAAAKSIDDGVTVLKSWYEQAKGTRIDSIRFFLETMGYKKAAPRGATKPTPEKAIESVERMVTNIEKQFVSPVDKKTGKKASPIIKESQAAQAIVRTVSNKLTLAAEAIASLSTTAELDAAAQAIERRRKEVAQIERDLKTKAQESVADAGKDTKATPAGRATRKAKVQQVAA